MVRKGLTSAASLRPRPLSTRREERFCCTPAPLPPRSGGEGSGVGGAAIAEAAVPADSPPPPTPPRHSLRSREEGSAVQARRGKQRRPLAQLRDLAAHFARAMPETFRPLVKEGAGNAGRPMRPIAACAMLLGRSAHALVRSHRNHPAFPTQWFTAYSALSPGTGLSCPRRLRSCLHRLDTSVGASGPHDFAVRFTRHSSKAHPRPPHPAPRS